MCLGENEPGGPSRCSGEALIACRAAQRQANDAATTVALLDREHEALSVDLIQLDDLEAALADTLPPEREAVLLERAQRFRDEEARRRAEDELRATLAADETERQWAAQITGADAAVDLCRQRRDEAIAAREHSWDVDTESEADRQARLTQEYHDLCQQLGQQPTADDLGDYIASELASTARGDEYQTDLCAGEYLADARAIAVNNHRGYAESLDVDTLDTVLAQRCTSDELSRLVADRDRARDELTAATEQWDQARAAYNERHPDALSQLEQAREQVHAAYADYRLTNDDLEHYKDCTAQYAGVLGEKVPQPEFTGSSLGQARMIGDYEEGSREWLEARQTGWGGSDAAKVLGMAKYGSKADAIANKVAPITDEHVAAQAASMNSYTGALSRGHAWEPVLARQFATENPDMQLRRSKASWKGREEWQNANVDGVLVNPDNPSEAVGIWEAKTSNNRDDWNNGIPAYYRPQLGQAMDTAGVNTAALTVNFDDGEVRTYWMNRNDPLDPTGQDTRTYADRKPELARAWETVQTARTTPPAPPKKNNGTFKFVNKPGSDSSHKTNADTARQLAVYRGCSVAEAEGLIRANLDNGMKADTAVRHAYTSYSPAADRQRRYVFVDFETNGTSAAKHEIVQTGYQVTDGRGNVLESANTLHDINPKTASTVGTGMVEVHQIEYQQLAGRRPFHRSPERDRLAQLAADPHTTIVAHNANFEMSFLRAHGVHTERVLDTMNLCRKFDHDSHGAKLSDFTAAHDVRYENAHDAYQDVDMTRRALFNFLSRR